MADDSAETTVAVLGLGSIGTRHARNLLHLGHRVIGFDPDAGRRAGLADLGGTPVTSRTAALAPAAAAVIATPNAQHLDDLRACIGAGCHVFVEKPLAHTTAGVEAVLAQAERVGLVVFTGFNLRFHPVVRAVRSKLANGALGTVLWARFLVASYIPAYRPEPDYPGHFRTDPVTGGVLFDIIHEFDLANFLLGPARVLSAAARRTGTLDIRSEDCADVILRHEGGAQSALHLDYASPVARRRFEISGTEGLIEADLKARCITHFGRDGAVVEAPRFPGGFDDDFVDEMRAFLVCVGAGATPACDGREALAVLEQVVEARAFGGLPSA